MKLYHFPRAPHARKVNIFLQEKGIEVPRVEVNLVEGENLKEAYLARSNRGVVPLLELDDGTCIDESLAICRYFENLHPEPALFGTEPQEKALIDSWERHMEFDGYLPGQDAFRNSVERFANYAVAGVQQEIRAIPDLAQRGRVRIDIFFARLDERLAEVPFIAGEKFSMADITGLVSVDMAKRSKKFLPEHLVNAQRWYKAMCARESVISTYIES
ncbi:MAG: glutathione S-transferase family protein [Gammaproteobacteria bacterium]|nr:glutathione S-transferase family protein [Gammaproteobacteria bacterium]